jgi:hypothetical protein
MHFYSGAPLHFLSGVDMLARDLASSDATEKVHLEAL